MQNSFMLTWYIGLYFYRLCIQKVQTDAQEGKEDVNICKQDDRYKLFFLSCWKYVNIVCRFRKFSTK